MKLNIQYELYTITLLREHIMRHIYGAIVFLPATHILGLRKSGQPHQKRGNNTKVLKIASKCHPKDIMKRICSSAKPIMMRDDKEFCSRHEDVLSLWYSVRLWRITTRDASSTTKIRGCLYLLDSLHYPPKGIAETALSTVYLPYIYRVSTVYVP